MEIRRNHFHIASLSLSFQQSQILNQERVKGGFVSKYRIKYIEHFADVTQKR